MEDSNRINITINRVAPSVSPIGRNDPTALSTKDGYVYRETGFDQLEDIILCGYVRCSGKRTSNQVWWTSGGENSFHVNKKPVLVASSDIVKDFSEGAISVQDLDEIWVYDTEKQMWENRIEDIKNKFYEVHPELFVEQNIGSR